MFPVIASALGFLGKTLFPALVPSVVNGADALIAKATGESPEPHTVDDQIKLQDADTRRLQAIDGMNKPAGQTSQWVNNMQVCAHIFACIGVLLFGVVVELIAIWQPVPADVVVTAAAALDVGVFVLVGAHVRKSRAK